MARRKHEGPGTWVGSWEGEVFAFHKENLTWLNPLRGAVVATVVTLMGLHFGGIGTGVALAIGSLFVAIVDVDQVAGRRWRTMLWTTVWLTVATALGGLASVSLVAIIALAIPVSLFCGFVGAAGPRAAIAGMLTLVVFSAYTFVPMTPDGAFRAAALVALGGFIQTLATVVASLIRDPGAWRINDRVPSMRSRLSGHATLRDNFGRHAIRLTVAMVIAFGLEHSFSSIHSVWIPITVAWVATPDRHGTVTKVLGRIIGTIASIALVLTSSWLTGYSDTTLVIFIALSAFLSLVMLRVNYPIAVVGVTAFMLSLFALAGDNVEVLGFDRAADTVLAALIVIAISFVILRGSAPDQQKSKVT